MTSYRKLAANKRNASLSTGPRTLGGKLRSRNNARRHGLAVRIGDDPTYARDIERLAKQLARFSNDFWLNEQARTFAECHFDLQRIRAVRGEEMRRIGELEAAAISEHAAAAAALGKIQRYEDRVLARRRKAVKELGLFSRDSHGK